MTDEAQKSAAPESQVLALTGASRDKADAWLDLQMEEMRQRNPYEVSHLRLRRFGDWAKAAFELSIGLIALGLVASITVMVWNAAHAEGLIVQSFAVPPDLAARGLSGEVVAGQLTDKLAQMQAGTSSLRAPKSYSNNWGDDIKVEIPQTGVSIGEAYRFLKNWLGHETHIGGEVFRSGNGLTIAARLSGGASSFSGAENDLDALLQKTAEDIYARTQPYRYGNYLTRHGRQDEALAVFRALALTGPPGERGWGYIGWGNRVVDAAGPAERERLLRAAEPYGLYLVTLNLAGVENSMGRWELSLTLSRKARAMLRGDASVNPTQLVGQTRYNDGLIANVFGDYRAAAAAALDTVNLEGATVNPFLAAAIYQIPGHDLAGARESITRSASVQVNSPVNDQMAGLNLAVQLKVAVEDWPAARAADQTLLAVQRPYPGRLAARRTSNNGDYRAALIAAHLGDFARAEALVRPMPADCYPCLTVRAQVAELQGQRARADFWFARAVAEGPSLPFAETLWGQALLDRKQPDAAIAQFTAANRKGPHFADALEGWGEALTAKNQSHLAVAKFAEAEKYAPNWGRLHLKWGMALTYTGNPEDAKAHFARAATLDLTPSEKSELSKVSRP